MKSFSPKLVLCLVIFANCTVFNNLFAQNVAINSTGSPPNASALLDMTATGKGLLIPRVTLCQRTTPSCANGMLDGTGNLLAAAQGLMVYQTDAGGEGQGFYYNTSTTTIPTWVKLFGGATGGIYAGSGSLTADPTTVTMGANNLAFTSTVVDGFSVDGTTFSIDAASNRVGVGISSPQRQLHLHNAASTFNYLHITNSTTGTSITDGMDVGVVNGEGRIFLRENADLALYTNGVERVTIDNTGDVGIGTTTPLSLLSVGADGDAKYNVYSSGASVTNGAAAIRAEQIAPTGFNTSTAISGTITTFSSGYQYGVTGDVTNSVASTNGRAHGVQGTAGNEDINFGVYGSVSGTQEGAAIFGWDRVTPFADPIPTMATSGKYWAGFFQGDGHFAGDVGIGTTSPARKLHVVGTTRISTLASGANGAIVTTNTSGDMAVTNFDGNASNVLTGAGTFVSVGGTGIGDNLGNHTATTTLNMVNFNVDNVNRLEFNDPGDQEGIIWAGSAAKIFVSPLNLGNSDGYLRLINDGGIVFEPGAEDSEVMTLTAAGNVGIGTTAPSTKLDVVGVLELSNVVPTDPGVDIVRLGDGGTSLAIQTNYGYTRVGPQNTSWSHYITDRPRNYFDKGISVNTGLIGSYDENLQMQTSGTTRMTLNNTTGVVNVPNLASGVNGAIVRTTSTGDMAITNFDGVATNVLTGAGTFVASSGLGDNLGNHIATTNLNMSNFEIDAINYADIRAGNGYGVRFWSSNSYAINMGNLAEYKYGQVTDYSIKMNMNATAGRGWTWGIDGAVPVASISNTGHMSIGGNLYGDAGDQLYKWRGLYFTWSPSYGTNTQHSIRSTYGDTYGDEITLNSYNHLRFNIDANNNDATSYFEVGHHTTGTGSILMRLISPSGNLGIGTTAPAYKLEASGDIYANGGWLRVSGNQGLYFQSWGGGFHMTDATWIRTYNNKSFYHNTGIMRTDGTFQVGSSGSRFIVQTGGNVGINRTSPGYKFHVYNSANIGGTSMGRFENAGISGVALTGYNTSASNAYNGIEGITSGTYSGVFGLQIAGSGGGYGVSAIRNSTSSSAYGLYASCPYSNSSGHYAAYFFGRVFSTGNYYIASDKKLKKNITPLNDGLKKILMLNPVRYEFKEEYNDFVESSEPQTGFIAQEVEKIFPGGEVVSPVVLTSMGKSVNPDSPVEVKRLDAKAVSYTSLIPYLVEAIQEQQTIIDSQNQKIKELEQRVTTIENE